MSQFTRRKFIGAGIGGAATASILPAMPGAKSGAKAQS